MSIWGVDYSEGYDVSTLQKWNAKFAVRYVGFTSPSLPQTKILTLSEARNLGAAGISIVSNWEWYNSRPSEGFDTGAWDAMMADEAHKACGGPPDRPIYFSVDYNSNGTEVADYFKGVASVIGFKRVGAYGGYACIQYLDQHGLINWRWQTYAWSGSLFYPGNNIYQYSNGRQLDNMQVDYDNAFTLDFGQWSLSPLVTIEGSTHMENQFDAVWTSSNAPKSGIYEIVKQGFMLRKYSACFPTSAELGGSMTDWAGNPIIYQTLSNGLHAEYANGHATVYDAFNNVVYSGHL